MGKENHLLKKKNQRIIALQCCVGFCQQQHMTMWISYVYTYIPSPFNLHPTHPVSYPSMSPESTEQSSLCYTAGFYYYFTYSNIYIYVCVYMYIYIFQCYCLNSTHPFLPQLCPQVCKENHSICCLWLTKIEKHIQC